MWDQTGNLILTYLLGHRQSDGKKSLKKKSRIEPVGGEAGVEKFRTKNTPKKKAHRNNQSMNLQNYRGKKRRKKQACNFPVNNLEIIIIIITIIIIIIIIAIIFLSFLLPKLPLGREENQK